MDSGNDSLDNLWFPFTAYQDLLEDPPVIVDHGRGIYIYDSKGKGYVDALGSWWVNILGHNRPEIVQAVHEQLDRLEHVMMAGFVTQPAVELSHLITSMLPGGFSRVFYSDNGSTAVEAALKMALQYWAMRGEPRTEFFGLSAGYHGDTLGAMSVGNIPQYHTLFHERFKCHHFAHSPYCYRCPVDKKPETCTAQCMDSLSDILEAHGTRTAACIFEPMVQAAGGMRIYPAKVMDRILGLCADHGVLAIADEIATGFGRTGKLFAFEYATRVPDIVCLAKGLTGGFLPLSATVVKEEFFEAFKGDHASNRTFHHGHSFTGNPLAAAAGCATLRVIQRENLPASVAERMTYFQSGLRHFSRFDIVGDIRSLGMIGALELVADRTSKDRLPPEERVAFRIARAAVRRGLILRPLGDVLYFMPPYVISDDVIDNMFYLAGRAFEDVVGR